MMTNRLLYRGLAAFWSRNNGVLGWALEADRYAQEQNTSHAFYDTFLPPADSVHFLGCLKQKSPAQSQNQHTVPAHKKTKTRTSQSILKSH